MSFLAPLFLLGAALIAGPLIFHLIRRATRNRVRFSATQFLRASRPRLQKRRSLQHPFLLFLRCLIIALLAFGFARPFFKHELPVPAREGKLRQTVVLLDESGSMRQTGVWERAQTRLMELLEGHSSDDQLSLLAVSNTVSHLLSHELWAKTPVPQRRALTRNILREREPGWGPTYLDQGMEAALVELDQMSEVSGENAEKSIVVVSDFGGGARLSGLAGYDWPVGCVVRLESVGGMETGNVGVQWLGWLKTANSGISARLQLIGSGEGQSVILQAFDAENGMPKGDEQSVYLPGGSKRVALYPFAAAPSRPVKLTIRGDPHPYDDQFWIAPKRVRQASIHYIGSAAADDPGQSRFYLERATAGWEDPLLKVEDVSESLDPKPADLVILEGDPLPGQRSALETFLSEGGIGLYLLTDSDQLPFIQSLIGETGWKLNLTSRDYALLGEIDFQHELFNIFADPRYSNFSNIRFWDTPSIQVPKNSRARVLAQFDDETAALVEIPVGKGRLYLWSGEWTPQASQWVLSSKFVPWLQRLMEQALGGPKRPSMIQVGEANRLSRGKTVTWRRLGSNTHEPSPPRRPGIYGMSEGDSSHWVAVNLPPQESFLEPLSQADWENLGAPLNPRESLASEQSKEEVIRFRTSAELESQQKVWRWFLLIAALTLAVESLVAILISKREGTEVPV
ncbi:MAG: VWA domain-containing protein [Opitutae bacterium]|nr:VWA domain-containing protein [Opitutae bacterium]